VYCTVVSLNFEENADIAHPRRQTGMPISVVDIKSELILIDCAV